MSRTHTKEGCQCFECLKNCMTSAEKESKESGKK